MWSKPSQRASVNGRMDEDIELRGLEAEMAQRRAKIAGLAASGSEPYPYRFDRSHTLGELRAEHGTLPAGAETEVVVTIAGRMMLRRDTGKLIFANLRDRSGDIQLFVSKSVVGADGFDAAKDLDLGDWIGISGTIMTTKTGELSVRVASLQLLAKAIRPLPDKWHGLNDVDTRFRQRYADLIVNDEARRVFEIRHGIIASFRRTLADAGYIEVETPVFHIEPGGAHARPFTTHHNALNVNLYLRIALELHLKRLIVGGMERVFEIGRIFRNEGLSTRHNPEFTMMELYEAFADWTDIMALTETLIVTAARDTLGTTCVDIDGVAVDLGQPWRRASIYDLIHEHVGVRVHPSMHVDYLRQVCDENGVKWAAHMGAGKLCFELYELAEKHLVAPTFVTQHPVEVSPLARVHRDDPYVTERFELVVAGRELANGYSELNDPDIQRLRFDEEQVAKLAGDAEAGSVDEDYLRALEYGMPPTGGLGVGMDRLTMLIAGVASIREVILFPTLRPETF